jgi:hypothetical protein
VVRRHPLQEDALLQALATAPAAGWDAAERPGEMLEGLIASGRVQRVRRHGRDFVAAGDLAYGANEEEVRA